MKDLSKITPDYSMNFRDIRDKFLNSSDYRKFLKTLNPVYWKVYLDLGIGYLFIFLSLLIASKIELFSIHIENEKFMKNAKPELIDEEKSNKEALEMELSVIKETLSELGN